MNILTANNSEMVTERTNITIAIKYKVAYGLSISIKYILQLANSEGQLSHRNSVAKYFLDALC